MCTREPLLLQLLRLVDSIPEPPPPSPRRRGRPFTYPDRLFLKVLLIMILRRLHRAHEIVSFLTQPSAEILQICSLLFPDGKMPSRRTFERRLNRLPRTLPAQIACLGKHLLRLYQPWQHCGRAVAIDSTTMRARGVPWHRKSRQTGEIPNTSIDTEAHWTHGSWHGWVYGWKLHVVTTMAAVWIPLAARLRPANEADNVLAVELIADLPDEARFVCGDSFYNSEIVRLACEQTNRILVASSRSKQPRTDPGVEVRKILHALRHHTIENFNALYKSIFDAGRPVPTKGLINTQRFGLGAVFAFQIGLLYRYHTGELHQANFKALLRSA
jgi:hypothetical protein